MEVDQVMLYVCMYVCVPGVERRGEERRKDMTFEFLHFGRGLVYMFMCLCIWLDWRKERRREGRREGRRYTDTMDQYGQIDCRLWTE